MGVHSFILQAVTNWNVDMMKFSSSPKWLHEYLWAGGKGCRGNLLGWWISLTSLVEKDVNSILLDYKIAVKTLLNSRLLKYHPIYDQKQLLHVMPIPFWNENLKPFIEGWNTIIKCLGPLVQAKQTFLINFKSFSSRLREISMLGTNLKRL